MPEMFLGDLSSQIKLFDVLKPLFDGKKTGRVVLDGKGGGELYLQFGDITHAKTGEAVGEQAFFVIMGLKAGKITFLTDEVPKEKTINISTEQLLINWSYRKQEGVKIKEVVPSPNAIFRLSVQKSGGDKNISADQWNILALCNGTKTVADIAETVAWDQLKTSRVISQLAQLGLLEKVDETKIPRGKLVPDHFFLTVETELKKAIGPMAPFVIDDKLADLGETKGSLSQDRASTFIEALSEEISNQTSRNEFLRAMAHSFSS
jgi:hypothetical protein